MPQTHSLLRSNLSILFVSFALIGCFAIAARAQSALDGFDPNANNAVRVVVVQPDGKILIGGDFTTLSPNGGGSVPRNHIARLNPDGTLDAAFNPNATGSVYAIAVQADGKVLAGGTFTGANSIGGQSRSFIARLDATTGAADSFDPNANLRVLSIAVQADGKILAGGDFTSIGGLSRNHIARLDGSAASTGAADSFNPNANAFVYVIALQADGKILAGGNFNGANSIGGQPRNRIARLDPTTGAADSFNPNANSTVYSFAVQADGKILVSGEFTSSISTPTIGGATRNYIARLDPTTGAADSFDPNANAFVYSIALQADGKILAGGGFTSLSPNGGAAVTRNNIARLDSTGAPDSFDPNANLLVYSIAVQADGKILAGGFFTTLSPNGGAAVTRNRIARLETDGRLDQTLDLGIAGSQVYATAEQPDGKIIIAGDISTVLGVTRNRIARLNTDGTLDTAFDPNANNSVFSIAVQPDGKILVGGNFSFIGGQLRANIARLDPVTGLADSWNPNGGGGGSGIVYSLAVQSDGKILAGGLFTTIGGQPRNRIARLDAVSGLADSWDPNANSTVTTVVLQADGKILVGGGFNDQGAGANSIGGQPRNHIARLDAVTGLADSWNPNDNSSTFSDHPIAVQSDGKILVGGSFSSIGGQPRNYIARLDPVTGAADSWNPIANNLVESIAVQADGKILAGGYFLNIGGQPRNHIARLDAVTGGADSFDPNANNVVFSVGVQADGKILAGGAFTGANSIGGQPREQFARLSNDTASLQNLAATQTTVTWTRGGASPQFTHVTFESSTDNVNYVPLGNGAATGSNWTLAGLNLTTGQNFYIRARGYYRGGYQNGSESIGQSVRNAFILGAPMITGTVTYGNAIGAPNPRFVSNATISGAGSPNASTVTDFPGGNYSLSGFGAGSYTVTPTKTNGQNGINSFDAARIAQHVAGTVLLTGNQLVVADVSGTNGITSFDAAEVARWVAGFSTQVGQTGNWIFSPVNRTYASVTANVTGQDYSGLLMGEVSGNWTNTGSRPDDSGSGSDSGSTGRGIPERNTAVELPRSVTPAGSEVLIPVNVQGAADKGVISYEFDLRYDPAVIQPQANPVDIAGTVSSKLSVVVNAEEAGLLRVVVYGPMPIDGNGILLNLRFTAVGAPGSVSPLVWERFMFNEDPVTTATAGQVSVTDQLESVDMIAEP